MKQVNNELCDRAKSLVTCQLLENKIKSQDLRTKPEYYSHSSILQHNIKSKFMIRYEVKLILKVLYNKTSSTTQ